MRPRTRLLACGSAAAAIAGAVLALRGGDSAPPPGPVPPPRPPQVTRYAADDVVLPAPGEVPDTPRDLRLLPSPGRLVVSWTGSVRATGYQVNWAIGGQRSGGRLVTTEDTQLDGLTDGQKYLVEVRAVDAFGQVSTPASATGVPGPGDPAWRTGLTGLLDDFPDDSSLRADTVGSSWHLSGYRGCVDLGARASTEIGLPIDLGCGADEAVLRARRPMTLTSSTSDPMLGRVAVLTDAAGPGGRLTLDLVPGPADRVGPDSALPAGTIRGELDDGGARVLPGGSFVAAPGPRGAGALHLVELTVSATGVTLSQDGRVVASSSVVPTWRDAWVLIGVRGPEGRRVRIHLASAGFTGPPGPVPQVVETPVSLATRQVLDPDAIAPSAGIVRRPLTTALSARLIVTMAVSPGMEVSSTRIQLGTYSLPARPAVLSDGVVTVIADVPRALLGANGPDPLTPLVVRAAGAGPGALVQESYLELVPAPDGSPRTTTQPARTDRQRPTTDALPTATLTLGDSAGHPAETPTEGRLVITVTISGVTAQWDTGALEPVAGFQLWLDGRMVAALPTGGTAGGRYAIPVTATPGDHSAEIRVFGTATGRGSTLTQFAVR